MAEAATANEGMEKEAMLDRMLTRLALTDDSKLQTVLSKLLPFVISCLSSPQTSIRQKVMEILKHINRRVKDQSAIQLPINELWNLYQSLDSAPMVKNFAIIYIEMALNRLPLEEKMHIAPEMLSGLSKLPGQHQDILLRIIIEVIECHFRKIDEATAEKYKRICEGEELSLFLGFCLKTILYQSPSSNPERLHCPPGLSISEVRRITGNNSLRGEQLLNRKLGILNVIESINLPAELIYPLYLAASIDSQDSVARRGEQLFKRISSNTNLEDHGLIGNLFSLFQGTVKDERISAEERISPVSLSMKVQLLSAFCHSIKAANSFPATLQCIFECIYGVDSNLRIKRGGMEFTVWVFKHASNAQLQLMGPVILSGLVKFLDVHTTAESERTSKELKAFAYQAIGLLAQRLPHLFRENINMATRLFQALKMEDSSSRFMVQEAVNSVSVAYKDCNDKVSKELEELLLDNAKSVESEARRCALHWATTLYALDHCPSRYICMLGAADDSVDIREMANHSLLLQTQVDKIIGGAFHSKSVMYPSLQQMLDYIAKQKPEFLCQAQMRESTLLFPTKMYTSMIRFCLNCLNADIENVKGDSGKLSDSVRTLCLLLEHALASQGSIELHAVASKGLLDISFKYPQITAVHWAERLAWLKQFVGHIDSDTRVNMSRLLGIACSVLSASSTTVLIQELCYSIKLTNKSRFEDAHGAICAIGYVLAQCMTGSPMVSNTSMEECLRSLVDVLMSSNLPLAAAAAEALGHIGLRGALFSKFESHLQRSSEGTKSRDLIAKNDVNKMIESSTEPVINLEHVHAFVDSIIARFKELLSSDDIKVVQKIAVACGHICYGDRSSKLADRVLDLLFSLSRSKVEDVLFSTGEAFAFIWGVIPITIDEILKSSYTSLSMTSNYLMDEITSCESTDSMMIENNASEDIHGDAKEKIINKIFHELLYSSRKEERLAGSIWLLSLVTYCGCHQKLKKLLPEIQEAFSYLLGDQNETTQEVASRGMSIVYDLGDSSMKNELVKALVNTLTGTTKRKRHVKLEEDSEVFEDGTIGERPGGGKLSTYKELCSLATEMGQPDLIYKFMDLANYQAMMNSKRGAAFGFSRIAKHSGDALMPYLRSLVPKLLRYQYDPDKMIQDAMGHIWRSLVAEPKKVIDEYWDDVIEELFTQIGSRLWRARESSCLALADLLQGRKFNQVDKYLKRIWIATFRAMDDIKETVRIAGERLCRAVETLSSRLCDSSLTFKTEAMAAISIVLPFMLSDGITSKVNTVQKVAINMVVKLSKVSGDVIRPHLPDLVSCMLESLSSLEDPNLNYAELHADNVGIKKEKFQSLRIAIAKDSPMWETLDFSLKYIDDSTLPLVVPRLVQLVRTGVGLNTRVGVARFISLLVQKVGSDIKPFVTTFARVLLPAVEGERSMSAKRAFAASCGCLLRYAAPSQAERMVDDAIKLSWSSDDRGIQVASAILLECFSREASDVIKRYHTTVLPVLFIARFDDDKEISRLFEDVWEENTTGESITLQLYLHEIVSMLCESLTSSSWARKKKSSKAVKMLAETLGPSLSPHVQELLKITIKETPGRIWEGKELILEATAALVEACHVSITTEASVSDNVNEEVILSSIISACSKKITSFREMAFTSLEKVIRAFGKPEIFNMVLPFLIQVCADNFNENIGNKSSSHTEHTEDSKYDSFALRKSLDGLAAALHTAKLSDILERGNDIGTTLINCLHPAHSWQVTLSAFYTIQTLYKRVSEATGSSEYYDIATKLIAESFNILFPLVQKSITTIKIAKVHVGASECLLDMVSVCYEFRLQIEQAQYDVLLQLHDTEKDQSAKLILKKSLSRIEDAMKA